MCVLYLNVLIELQHAEILLAKLVFYSVGSCHIRRLKLDNAHYY